MAATDQENLSTSAQVHIPMCEKHDLPIDLACEDCDEFICSQCAKTDHKDHDWKTISTAGSLRRRELRKTLSKVKEEDVKAMDEKIQKATKQMEDNKKCCDSEVSKLQKHYDAIVSKLNEIKKSLETNLRNNLEQKNAEVIEKKLDLEKKTKQVMDLVKFLEEKHGTMSDYSLIENLRDLTSLNVSNTDSDIEKGGHSVRYRRGDISEGLLESMMGQTFNLDEITVNETDSFQYGDQPIIAMEAINEDTCFVRDYNSGNIQQVNRMSENGMKININATGVCVTDNGDVYITDCDNSIVHLSPSGSVSTVFSTAPLVPVGICPSTEGGLLVILGDTESKAYQPDSHSRRLVRHVTLTGDVIREYEYQEDGQTRLFNVPWKVRQNGTTDICVVNWANQSNSELVILSLSGYLKSVYHGQKLMNKFLPTDVVCDKHCNIIVNDHFNSKIHLLSPDGEFMKYLLTENEVTNPSSMSLYNSTTLWVGGEDGLVKVFQYKT